MTINNNSLGEEFKDIYKNFYLANNLVLSGCHVLTWAPGFTHGLNVSKIKQKIPAKGLCGINIIQGKEVKFNNIFTYSKESNTFVKSKFNSIYGKDTEIVKLIKDFLKLNGFESGLELNFLSEKTKGQGFSSFSVFAVLIATGLFLLLGKISIKQLSNYEEFKKNKYFNEILDIALKITTIKSNGSSQGGNILSVIHNESLPIVYAKNHTIQEESDSRKRNKYKIYTMENLMKTPIDKNTILPIDYGIVSFGMNHSFEEMKFLYPNLKKEYEEIKNDILPEIKEAGDMSFFKNDIDGMLLGNINFSLFKIINGFKNIISNMYDNDSINKFIKSINEAGILSLSYEKEFKLFMKINYIFDKVKQYNDENIGLFPFNIGKNGGSFFFVTKYKSSRETMHKIVEELRKEYPSVELDYISWKDGYSNEGVIIEQYLTRDIYSNYIPKNSLLFTDTKSNIYIGSYKDLIENNKKGIILDKIKMKIYVNGDIITSKAMHSQHTTIEVLELLLKNINSEISNAELSASSYSKNKNELLTKIILPLQKIIKESFGEKLEIECYGAIGKFYIKMAEIPSIQIGIIEDIKRNKD